MITELYVDPSIAGDSGAGTVGDPYGDLEYAIEQETFDLVNGTRVNIKAGTDEVLVGALHTAMADTSVSIAWVPSQTSPLVFEGYTAAAGDGGKGQIDGSGIATSVYLTTAVKNVNFVNLIINGFNNGASGIIRVSGLMSSVIGCEVHTNSSGPGLYIGDYGTCVGNYVHDCNNYQIYMQIKGLCAFNIARNNLREATTSGIYIADYGACFNNIVQVDGATGGIHALSGSVIGNSIWSNGGTGTGIELLDADGTINVIDNCIEGFSGTGGNGIDLNLADATPHIVAGNSIYNCATDSTGYGLGVFSDLDQGAYYETLTASPFTDAANMDFSPVDTGTVKEGSAFKFWTI